MVSAGATVKNFSRSRGIEVGSILGALSWKQEQKKWFRRFSFSLEFLVVWDKYERSSGNLLWWEFMVSWPEVLWGTDLTGKMCEEGLLGLLKDRGGSVAHGLGWHFWRDVQIVKTSWIFRVIVAPFRMGFCTPSPVHCSPLQFSEVADKTTLLEYVLLYTKFTISPPSLLPVLF